MTTHQLLALITRSAHHPGTRRAAKLLGLAWLALVALQLAVAGTLIFWPF